MNTNNKKNTWTFFGVLFTVMIVALVANTIYSPERKPLKIAPESNDYYTIMNEQGEIVLETGEQVHINDEYIDENNNHYIIFDVKGNQATARIKSSNAQQNQPAAPAVSLFYPEFFRLGPNPATIAIYHTHTDESYLPTSGTVSKPGDGDIYKVGLAMGDALKKARVKVVFSADDHGPHDINAYHRSRRTAVNLLKNTPYAIFDIHRDSAPVSAYTTTINGVTVSRVMIVVGRSNPNMQTNLDFARAIKAASDQLYPGLLRGIFIGQGDYNQDLYPTALLFEVGTEQIPLSMATKGARCLSDAILAVLSS